jgi:hypothetical protein
MEIKVLGPGRGKCHEAERLVKGGVAENGANATVDSAPPGGSGGWTSRASTGTRRGRFSCGSRVDAPTESWPFPPNGSPMGEARIDE